MTGAELSDLIFALRCRCIDRDEQLREECNLSPVEFRALTSLTENDQVSASEFAEKLELSPSRMSRVIDRMVQTGLIEVEANPLDRRAVFIKLSSRGVKQKQLVEAGRELCNSKLETLFSKEDRREIGEALQKLVSAF